MSVPHLQYPIFRMVHYSNIGVYSESMVYAVRIILWQIPII